VSMIRNLRSMTCDLNDDLKQSMIAVPHVIYIRDA
jgi:hypothetical protein